MNIDELEGRLGTVAAFRIDWTGFAASAFAILEADAQMTFAQQRSPEGAPWAALTPSTRRRKQKRGKGDRILWDSGTLAASASTTGAEGAIRKATPAGAGLDLEYGSSIGYGAFYQQGTRYMPARPWLGPSPEAIDKLAEAAADFAAEQVRRALAG